MFSIFSKKKISINSVSIPDLGWTKVKSDQSSIVWVNPEQTIAVSVHFFEVPPDIPTIKNIEILRSFYRQSIANANGGLIEVELSQKNKMSFVKTLLKLPQEQSGVTYIASLTLPFSTCSFVFKVQAVEAGMTGMREAIIADRLLSANTISIGENGYLNWFSDPYDNSFQGGLLMNKAEQYSYDIEFPNHHLTQARQLIKEIENSLQWTPELEKIPAFDK
jgi:hypothetical protein